MLFWAPTVIEALNPISRVCLPVQDDARARRPGKVVDLEVPMRPLDIATKRKQR